MCYSYQRYIIGLFVKGELKRSRNVSVFKFVAFLIYATN